MTLIADYRLLTRNMPATLARTAKQPEIKRETENYLKEIGNIKSVDEFMANDRIYRYALQAFGLKDMTYAKAFIRKVLQEGIDSPRSFTMQLADTRFREFAEAFNFARHGRATTSFTRTQQGTVDRYMQNAVEIQAGQSDERLRLALNFQRKAPSLSSAFSVLADKAVYTVVRTALGLPAALSSADIDRQAAIIAERLDVTEFKDPAKLDRFVTRYMAMSLAEGGASQQLASSPAASLLQGIASSVDMSTLMSIQSLRRPGA